eukprot:14356120-Alexandrium_andersonii.AAC.1
MGAGGADLLRHGRTVAQAPREPLPRGRGVGRPFHAYRLAKTPRQRELPPAVAGVGPNATGGRGPRDRPLEGSEVRRRRFGDRARRRHGSKYVCHILTGATPMR